jgi:hypothetical protein
MMDVKENLMMNPFTCTTTTTTRTTPSSSDEATFRATMLYDFEVEIELQQV